jgi:hypothetical protein
VRCRVEGAIEDELLHELWGLEECVALAGVLRQVLVEVAEKACAPLGVAEVMDEGAGGGVDALPQVEELAGAIT